MNLLDLPEEMLIEILSYCKGKRTLIKATEVCKQFKLLIEETPRLNNQLQLRVRTSYGDELERDAKKLKRYLRSQRKYRSINVNLHNKMGLLITVKDQNCYLEKLLRKHAETAKEVTMEITTRRRDINQIALNYVLLLPNVERATISLISNEDEDEEYDANYHLYYFNSDSSGSDLDEDQLLPRKKKKLSNENSEAVENFEKPALSKLKHLDMIIDSSDCSYEWFFCHRSLDTWLSIINPETLQSLSLECFSIVSDSDITDFLEDLIASRLNLKSFKLHFFDVDTRRSDTTLLSDFLKSQKKLRNLDIKGGFGHEKFLREDFPEVLESLGHLKSLEFNFMELAYQTYASIEPSMCWKLKNLEKLNVHLHRNPFRGRNINSLSAKILFNGSESLKELDMAGIWNFEFFGFDRITSKFPNLATLKVAKSCRNYSSNDIIYILKNLKQLKVLSFEFPADELDEKLFDQYGDKLILPKIAEVNFKFNDSISNRQVQKLMKSIKNCSSLEIRKCSTEYSVASIIKKLPKLENLDLKVNKFIEMHVDWQPKINSTLKKFNENPQNFKCNGKRMFDNTLICEELSDCESDD